MDKYFSSHEVTVSTVFACLCWIKSVAALQGNGDLCQTTNITLNHTTDLMNQIDASVAKGAVKAVDKQLHGFLEYYSETIKTSAQYSHLAYTNPLLAGLTMLDHHLEYMDLASEVMAASKLCSFGHLYNALVNEGLCCRIPFFDEILVIYEKMIFTPSRAAAVRGAYVRMYLLNSGLKVASLDALVRGKRLVGSTADNTKSRTRLYMNEVSKIYRLMTQDDKSFLRAGSSKSLLNMATEVCSQELYDSRVLSRDMLKLHDDLTDTFSEMRGMLTESDIRFSSDEDEVTLRLLRICDILQPNDELDVSLLRGNHHPRIDKATRAMCKKAAEVIEVKFDNAIKVATNKAETVTRLGEDDGSAELSAMLKQLLVSVSAGTNALDETNTTTLQDSLRQAATGAFSRLRDPDIPPFLKVDDAQSVCKVVAKLQELAEKFSDPRRQDATTLCVRQFIFAESSRVIHMMKRFHRTDHPAMTVPVLAKVRELCTPKPDFVQFVISVAHIGVSADRTVQAREILDLLEKCLLQMRHCKLKDPYYREMVQQYSTARDAMGMGLTSSPDSFRILEWYLTNAMSNMQALVSLDAMDGQPFYLEMVTSAFQDTSELERGLRLPGIACFGNCLKHVVYGGPKESVARARGLVIEVAKTAGVEFSESNSQQCATSVRVNEFKFSSSGIIRDTAP
ncbi:hypothetical protein PHMEG_00017482 [Phytophthora megakarya]|uniref:Uncharacterized protein n=1 Tax=Phytophthora megakarya TaxID=4795 RepID=A0A225VWP5_9STRA|nr:hypothetical protein PHMEG_00017482 [Phytophthora megakarya]